MKVRTQHCLHRSQIRDIKVINAIQEGKNNSQYSQILQEMKNKLLINIPEKNSIDYKDLQKYLINYINYPLTSKARLHRDANKLGKFLIIYFQEDQTIRKNNNQNRNKLITLQSLIQTQEKNKQNFKIIFKLASHQCCPCCGFKQQKQELDALKDSLYDIPNIGLSTFCYFRALQNIFILLVVIGIVFSSFAFISNIIAAKIQNFDVKSSTIMAISYASKIANSQYLDLIKAQSLLGLILVLSLFVSLVMIQYYSEGYINQLKNECSTAADYSITIFGAPIDIFKQSYHDLIQKLQNQFKQILAREGVIIQNQNLLLQDRKISKINVARNISFQQKKRDEWAKNLKGDVELFYKNREKIINLILELREQNTFKTNRQQRFKIEKDFLSTHNQIKSKQKNVVGEVKNNIQAKNKDYLSTVFLTFQSQKYKQLILNTFQYKLLDNFRAYVSMGLWQKTIQMEWNEKKYHIIIQQAPEPEDIVWSNMGKSSLILFRNKLITTFVAIILLSISFAVVFGLSTIQLSTKSSIISLLISLFISIFNFLIIYTLKILTYLLQKDYSVTRTQTSVAIKSIIAQLINTIAIPITVSQAIRMQNPFNQIDGLTYNVFILGITSAFVWPLFTILGVDFFFINYLLVKLLDRPYWKFNLSQIKLNKVFELQQFQHGYQYIYLVNLFLFNCFFISLQPLIFVFALLGLIFNYWATKYYLFYRCKRPVPGTILLYDTIYHFICAGGLFYATGNILFTYIIPEEKLGTKLGLNVIVSIVSMALGFLSVIVPYSYVCRVIRKYLNTQIQSQNLKRNFQQARLYLPSQYDRLNPATAEQEIRKYIDYVKQHKMSRGSNSGVKGELGFTNLGNVFEAGRRKSQVKFNQTATNNVFLKKDPMQARQTIINPKYEIIRPRFLEDCLASEILKYHNQKKGSNKQKQGSINQEIQQKFENLPKSNIHKKYSSIENKSQQNISRELKTDTVMYSKSKRTRTQQQQNNGAKQGKAQMFQNKSMLQKSRIQQLQKQNQRIQIPNYRESLRNSSMNHLFIIRFSEQQQYDDKTQNSDKTKIKQLKDFQTQQEGENQQNLSEYQIQHLMNIFNNQSKIQENQQSFVNAYKGQSKIQIHESSEKQTEEQNIQDQKEHSIQLNPQNNVNNNDDNEDFNNLFLGLNSYFGFKNQIIGQQQILNLTYTNFIPKEIRKIKSDYLHNNFVQNQIEFEKKNSFQMRREQYEPKYGKQPHFNQTKEEYQNIRTTQVISPSQSIMIFEGKKYESFIFNDEQTLKNISNDTHGQIQSSSQQIVDDMSIKLYNPQLIPISINKKS